MHKLKVKRSSFHSQRQRNGKQGVQAAEKTSLDSATPIKFTPQFKIGNNITPATKQRQIPLYRGNYPSHQHLYRSFLEYAQ
ncbi:hypothetical protein NIES4073_42450 [Kalymmatonema gypsitolerans NIES-4073]|nr:hypothetical protein NIES4073_42450 [Scytonema sp. NIES-4073]